jgi:hypothetical protein
LMSEFLSILHPYTATESSYLFASIISGCKKWLYSRDIVMKLHNFSMKARKTWIAK